MVEGLRVFTDLRALKFAFRENHQLTPMEKNFKWAKEVESSHFLLAFPETPLSYVCVSRATGNVNNKKRLT